VAVPVTRRRRREHLIARRHQRGDEQTAVGLDSDHHRLIDVASYKVMESGNALHSLGQAIASQSFALLVLQENVMMSFRPVHPYEYHWLLLCRPARNTEPEGPLV